MCGMDKFIFFTIVCTEHTVRTVNTRKPTFFFVKCIRNQCYELSTIDALVSNVHIDSVD